MDYTEILINIRKITRSINLESKRIQKQFGISIHQYLCLNFLNNQYEYKATAKEIGLHLKLNASTVSGIVSRLENKGYLAKLPNQSDKRSTFIYLTAIGGKTVSSIPDLLHEKLTKRLKSLSSDDLENLQIAMDLIVEFMGVEDVDISPMVISGEDIV
jgi:DNA-binding MarR family transcriptional regulator